MATPASPSAERWSWTLGPVRFEVVTGSLLDATTSSIVNSEQTDFRMATGGTTVSGQLYSRRPSMQKELDLQTGGAVLPSGSVLETRGPSGGLIFHAGFHEPEQWLSPGEELPTFFLEAIRRCTREIFRRVAGKGLRSVAFPVIGTGVFGLAHGTVAEMMFEETAIFARDVADGPVLVQLYVFEQAKLLDIVAAGTVGWTRMLPIGRPLLASGGGHLLVQQMRSQVRDCSDSLALEKRILRFAEVAAIVDLAVLANAAGSSFELLRKRNPGGVLMTFGLVSDLLSEVVACAPAKPSPHHVNERRQLLTTPEGKASLRRLVHDRNDEAHLRQPRPIPQILEDVEQLYGRRMLSSTWPDAEVGSWIKRDGTEFAVLSGVDFLGKTADYLLPCSRRSERVDLHAELA